MKILVYLVLKSFLIKTMMPMPMTKTGCYIIWSAAVRSADNLSNDSVDHNHHCFWLSFTTIDYWPLTIVHHYWLLTTDTLLRVLRSCLVLSLVPSVVSWAVGMQTPKLLVSEYSTEESYLRHHMIQVMLTCWAMYPPLLHCAELGISDTCEAKWGPCKKGLESFATYLG